MASQLSMSNKRKASEISGHQILPDVFHSPLATAYGLSDSPGPTEHQTPTKVVGRQKSNLTMSNGNYLIGVAPIETDAIDSISQSASEMKEANQDYEVEKIIGKRSRKGRPQYFVKWAGFGDEEGTWEPEENLVGAKDAIQAYLDGIANRTGKYHVTPSPVTVVQSMPVTSKANSNSILQQRPDVGIPSYQFIDSGCTSRAVNHSAVLQPIRVDDSILLPSSNKFVEYVVDHRSSRENGMEYRVSWKQESPPGSGFGWVTTRGLLVTGHPLLISRHWRRVTTQTAALARGPSGHPTHMNSNLHSDCLAASLSSTPHPPLIHIPVAHSRVAHPPVTILSTQRPPPFVPNMQLLASAIGSAVTALDQDSNRVFTVATGNGVAVTRHPFNGVSAVSAQYNKKIDRPLKKNMASSRQTGPDPYLIVDLSRKHSGRPLPNGLYNSHNVASNVLIAMNHHPWLPGLNAHRLK